jgi:hypothetical protein
VNQKERTLRSRLSKEKNIKKLFMTSEHSEHIYFNKFYIREIKEELARIETRRIKNAARNEELLKRV